MTLFSNIPNGINDEANVANLFIKMGYFVRPHIQIYPQDSMLQVSDIDVLAVKFDRHLNKHSVLVEVKKNSTKISDLFKLYGFKSYFKNQESYFISEKIPDTFLEIAKNLSVKAMPFKMLRFITRGEQKEIKEQFTGKDIISMEEFLKNIRGTHDANIYWKFRYVWLERNPYTKFFYLQKIFDKTNSLPDTAIEVLWFRKELFLQAFMTLLDITSDCTGMEEERITKYVEGKFYDVGTTKEGKLKVKKGVDTLVEIIKKLAEKEGEKIEIPSIDVVPKYLDKLIFLIKRTIQNAGNVHHYLVLNDLVYRSNLHGKTISIEEISQIKSITSELKNTNDILLRILHSGPIKPDFNNFV